MSCTELVVLKFKLQSMDNLINLDSAFKTNFKYTML